MTKMWSRPKNTAPDAAPNRKASAFKSAPKEYTLSALPEPISCPTRMAAVPAMANIPTVHRLVMLPAMA